MSEQDEQIPTQFVVEEMQATIARQANELLLVRSQIRYHQDTLRQLQEHSVSLQKRLTEYEDRDGMPDAG